MSRRQADKPYASPQGTRPRGCTRYPSSGSLRGHMFVYLGWTLTYLLCLLYVAAAWYFPEATGKIVRCPLHSLTGLHCPTCGLTRAAMALLHGNPAEAASHNLLIFPVMLLTVLFPIVLISDLCFGTRLLLLRRKRRG